MHVRILQVSSTYYPELQFGGPPQKIHALSRGLQARGHQVSVIACHSQQPAANHEVEVDGIHITYLPWIGRGLWQVPRTTRPLVRAVVQADVVHAYGLYNLLSPIASRQAETNERPFILEPQGMYAPRGRSRIIKQLYHRLFTHRMFASADAVIATSFPEREDLAPAVAASKLCVRRNGIDPHEFGQLPDRGAFRRALGIELDAQMILFLGRISPIKNLDQLVQAFLQARLSRSYLVLAGPTLEPDYERRVRGLIQSLGLTGSVLLVGSLFGEAKLAAFASADLFVLPSTFESFGNAAAEAVAAGLPVLVTDRCGIAELIHHRAGLAVPATVEGLRVGMIEMLVKDRRGELTRFRAEVVRELAWEGPLRQMEELYQSLAAASRQTSGRLEKATGRG